MEWEFSKEADAKLMLSDFSSYAEKVSKAYLARPKYEAEYADSWKVLMTNLKTMYKRLQSKFEFAFVEEDPYKSMEEMRDDVKKTGVLKIYKGHSDHPIWSVDENLIFRAVHDALGHLYGYKKGKGHKFDLRGELGVYNRQVKVVSPKARLALFTEIVGQVCTSITTGSFPVQKICKLHGFDFVQVGKIDTEAYELNFETGFKQKLAAKYTIEK